MSIGEVLFIEYYKAESDLSAARMKFMKLGSKPDSFQTDGKNVRYDTCELKIFDVLSYMLLCLC